MKLTNVINRREEENEPWLIGRIMDRRWKNEEIAGKLKDGGDVLFRQWLSPRFYLEISESVNGDRCYRLFISNFFNNLFIHLPNLPNFVEFNNGYPSIPSRLIRDWTKVLNVYTWCFDIGWELIYYVNKSYVKFIVKKQK